MSMEIARITMQFLKPLEKRPSCTSILTHGESRPDLLSRDYLEHLDRVWYLTLPGHSLDCWFPIEGLWAKVGTKKTSKVACVLLNIGQKMRGRGGIIAWG